MSSFSDSPASHRLLAVLLFIFSFSIVAWANYSSLASLSDGMASQDFMSLWLGAKTIVTKVNPYDISVWRPLRASYGSTMLTDTIAPFPMWTFVFFVPFSYLSTQAAGALWMTICEFSLILGVFILARELGWKDRAPYFLLLGVVSFRPLFPSITNGQLVPALFLLLVVTYILHRQGHPFAAGFLLTLQSVKPNLALFLLITAGLIFLIRRDWRALADMVAGGLFLLVASWIAMPGWLFKYFKNAEKTRATRGMPTVWGLTFVLGPRQLWPGSAIVAGTLVFLGLLFLIWKYRQDGLLFSLSVAVIAATFLTPYAWAYEQLILLFPNIVALRWGLTSERGPRWAWWAGWWLVGSVMSWLLFLVALRHSLDVVSGFMPLFSLGYLVLAWRIYRQEQVSSNLAPLL